MLGEALKVSDKQPEVLCSSPAFTQGLAAEYGPQETNISVIGVAAALGLGVSVLE